MKGPRADGRRILPTGIADPGELESHLADTGYLADDGLATAVFLSLVLERPLFLEGEAGVGKTSLAFALGDLMRAPVIRLQCYEGISASQALYDWNFPRQLLHMRAAEAAGACGQDDAGDLPADLAGVDRLERDVYSRHYLLARPLLSALETSPCVLLVDEIDRADDEFEALLLEVLSDYTVTIPELGRVRAEVPPAVVLTSNRTREVHDALKRRCLYHWIEHPSFEREVAIVRRRVPLASEALARQVAAAVQALREEDLQKPPGVAETIDWTLALLALGADSLGPDAAVATLGTVLKNRDDQLHALGNGVTTTIARVAGRG
ncbi:MAG: AAA family ATPase [Acidimicrobiales bacterium]